MVYHLVSGCGDKYLGIGKFVIHRLVVEQRSALGTFVVSYAAVFKTACRYCGVVFELKMPGGVDYYFVADDFFFTLGISKHLTAALALIVFLVAVFNAGRFRSRVVNEVCIVTCRLNSQLGVGELGLGILVGKYQTAFTLIVCLAAVGIAARLNGGMICKFNMSRCLNCKFGVGEFGFAVLIGKDESASRAFVVFFSAVFKTLGRYCLMIGEVVTCFNDDVVFIHLILAGGIGEVSAASRTGIVCYITVFGAGGFYCRMGGEFVGKGRYLHARYLISAGFVGIILAAVIASVVRNIARMLACGGNCRNICHIVTRGGYGEFGIRKFGIALGVRKYQTAARALVVLLGTVARTARRHCRMLSKGVTRCGYGKFGIRKFGFALGVCKYQTAVGALVICRLAVRHARSSRAGMIRKFAVTGGGYNYFCKRKFLFALFICIYQLADVADIVCDIAVFNAGGLFGGYSRHIVPCSFNNFLRLYHFAADRALFTIGQAVLGTGGCLAGHDFGRVTRSLYNFLLLYHFAADRALFALGQAVLGTGGCLAGQLFNFMTSSGDHGVFKRNFRIAGFVRKVLAAFRTLVISLVAGLGTSRLCGFDRRNDMHMLFIRLIVAARTGGKRHRYGHDHQRKK